MGTNYGSHGKKGVSGRKSAYIERADASRLWDKWSNPQEVSDLREKIKSGEPVSLEDIFFAMAAGKNPKVLIEIFKKIYPDNINLFGQQDINININNNGEFYIHSAQSSTGSDESEEKVQGGMLREEVRKDDNGGSSTSAGSSGE